MDYTKKQIADITGLSPRLVQFYTEEKLILPEKDTGKGRGNVRKYSKKSLLDFLIIAELVNFGVVKSRMIKFLKYVHVEPKAKDYIKGRFYEKGFKFFFYMYILKNSKKAVADCKMISSGQKKVSILSLKEMENFSSSLIIDYGELVQKANKG